MLADNVQFYLNLGEPCPPMGGGSNCLKKNNYLSEFATKVDKELAVNNLGVPDIVEELVDNRISKLVETINRLWVKIGEITGDLYEGIVFTVNPRYYIGTGELLVHISANTGSFYGMFESLQLYVNDEKEPRINQKNVGHFEMDIWINGTSELTCKAKMGGITYTESRTIINYEPVWLGGLQNYDDAQSIMTNEHLVSLEGSHTYFVKFNSGDMPTIIMEGKRDNSNILWKNLKSLDMGGVRFHSLLEWQEVYIDNKIYNVGMYKVPQSEETIEIHINQ